MPKLTVVFSDKVNGLLVDAANRNRISKTDVLRRAIALFEFVDRNVTHAEPSGSRGLALVDSEDRVMQKIVIT